MEESQVCDMCKCFNVCSMADYILKLGNVQGFEFVDIDLGVDDPQDGVIPMLQEVLASHCSQFILNKEEEED